MWLNAAMNPMTRNLDAAWTKHAAKAILLLRILVGWVFQSEAIQKFLFPESGNPKFIESMQSVKHLHFIKHVNCLFEVLENDPLTALLKSEFEARH